MKKKNLKSLKLNKKSISNLHPLLLRGGDDPKPDPAVVCKTFNGVESCKFVCHTRDTFDLVCFEATFSTRLD